jgi:hypothetical protein
VAAGLVIVGIVYINARDEGAVQGSGTFVVFSDNPNPDCDDSATAQTRVLITGQRSNELARTALGEGLPYTLADLFGDNDALVAVGGFGEDDVVDFMDDSDALGVQEDTNLGCQWRYEIDVPSGEDRYYVKVGDRSAITVTADDIRADQVIEAVGKPTAPRPG